MDAWVIITVVAGVVAIAFGAALLFRYLWLRSTRRSLVALTARMEGMRLTESSLIEMLGALAESPLVEWERFVTDPGCDERRALAEVRHRMDTIAHDLSSMTVPRVLCELADEMQATAEMFSDEVALIAEADDVSAVLLALERLDLNKAHGRIEALTARLNALKQEFGVTDDAVYGGGLYI
ncbi:MAG: hypothetical protein Kow0056_01920 [Coriobacteriia bacterium]